VQCVQRDTSSLRVHDADKPDIRRQHKQDAAVCHAGGVARARLPAQVT